MKPSFDPEALFALPAGFGGARLVKHDDRAQRAKLLGSSQSNLPMAKKPAGGLSMLALRSGRR